jgi:hypothetical protein
MSLNKPGKTKQTYFPVCMSFNLVTNQTRIFKPICGVAGSEQMSVSMIDVREVGVTWSMGGADGRADVHSLTAAGRA